MPILNYTNGYSSGANSCVLIGQPSDLAYFPAQLIDLEKAILEKSGFHLLTDIDDDLILSTYR